MCGRSRTNRYSKFGQAKVATKDLRIVQIGDKAFAKPIVFVIPKGSRYYYNPTTGEHISNNTIKA